MNIDKIKEVLKKGKKFVLCGSLVALCVVPINQFKALQEEPVQEINAIATSDFAPFEQDGKKLQHVVINHTGIYTHKLGYLSAHNRSLVLDVAFGDEEIDLSYLVSISNDTDIYCCDAMDCCDEVMISSGGVSKTQAANLSTFHSGLRSIAYLVRSGQYDDVLSSTNLEEIKER